MEENDLIFIQNQIGYKFNNPDLLQQAFVRRSYSQENGGENNEVLEFVGDKVLDFFAVKLLTEKYSNSVGLYKKFDPELKSSWSYNTEKDSFPEQNVLVSNRSESELTEIKKLLVQKKTLAGCIDRLGISKFLLMGHGDQLQNTGEQSSVKEDLFEAILGAIAIDCDWNTEEVQTAVETMLSPNNILAEHDHLRKNLSIRDEIEDPNKDDAINQLEILSRRGYFSIPTYDFRQTYDKDGNPIWESICRIEEKERSFSASSSSKKDAKKSAAFKMLHYVLCN